MMKKLVFATFFITLAVFSAFAQNSLDNFLGNWKSTKLEGFTMRKTIQSVTLNVTQAAGDFKIERTIQGVYEKKDYSYTTTSSYKVNGDISTTLLATTPSRSLTNYMKIIAPNKLIFRYGIQDGFESINSPGYVGTDYWTLSEDGKTLTVETVGRYGSTKAVFTKQ